MTPRFGIFMVHAMILQIIVLALRLATSYQAIDLGLGALGLGLISASFALLPLALALPLGRLIDARGEFIAIGSGTLALLVTVLAFSGLATTIAGLAACTVMLGCAHFLSMVGQHSYVTTNAQTQSRDSQFGWYAAAISLGQMIGPAVIAVFSDGPVADLGMIYKVCIPLAVLQLGTLFFLARGKHRGSDGAGDAHRTVRELMGIKGVRPAILAGVAVMAAMDLITIYLPLLGTERNIDASVIAALLTVRAGFTLFSRISYGYLAAIMTRGTFLSSTLGAAAVACSLFILDAPTWVLFAAMAIYGFGLGAALPITLTWISAIAPQNDRGTVFSLRQSVLRASQVVIPVAGGGLAAIYGTGGIFIILSVFLLGTAVISRRQ